MSIDAFTLALTEGLSANNILEKTSPTTKEIEQAVKHFDTARKALKAALTLIDNGVYQVAPNPLEN